MFRIKSPTLYCKNSLKSSFAYARQLCSQGLSTEQPNSVAGIASLKGSTEAKMEATPQQQQQQQVRLHSRKTSIYRVPAKLRNVEPKAYNPQIVSIGPYHRGSPHLQDSERFKRDSLTRVVGSGARAREEHYRLSSVLAAIEPEARSCYSEDVGLSKDEFVEMMLLDGCFIVELFRDLKQSDFTYSSLLPKRWMLPVVQRDLILLENQMPMKVLKKILEQTKRSNSMEETLSIEAIALNFFLGHLIPGQLPGLPSITSSSQQFHHLLDVFHSRITLGTMARRGVEPSFVYGPLTELRKADVKVRLLRYVKPLEIRLEGKELKVPYIEINNQTSRIIKNIVAYEQCHNECNPDMTAYLFFLHKLINSAEDVAILQDAGVMLQCLGTNQQIAELVKNLCLEVEHDGHNSYLYKVINRLRINGYYSPTSISYKLKTRVKLWFKDPLTVLLLYLALLQTCCTVIAAQGEGAQHEMGVWAVLHSLLVDPFQGVEKIEASARCYLERIMKPDDFLEVDDDCMDLIS